MAAYDAFLLVSFGGPEGPADVMPFLRNVTAGRNVPDSRLEQVAEHYYRFGGVSPINQQCRDLLAAIEKDFEAAGIDLPVYWGNRNWHALPGRHPGRDGRRRGAPGAGLRDLGLQLLLQLPAVPGGHRAGPGGRRAGRPGDRQDPAVLPPPGLRRVRSPPRPRRPLESLPAAVRGEADLVFTAHSIPEAMAERSGPGRRRLPGPAGRGGRRGRGAGWARPWRLAYSSRSGPPSQPWLVPDVNDCLAELAAAGLAGRGRGARSASSPTTWRSGSTWTSRRPRRPSGSACRSPGRPRPAPARGSSR